MKTVYLDIAKGGYFPGAVVNDLIEKDLTLQHGLVIKTKLESKGYNVVVPRLVDRYVPSADRVKQAIDTNSDILVSINFPMTSDERISGITTYRHTRRNENTDSFLLQDIIHNDLSSQYISMGSKDRGKQVADYLLLREFPKHAVHIGLGVMSNNGDAALIRNAIFMDSVTTTISNGIDTFFKTCGCEDE